MLGKEQAALLHADGVLTESNREFEQSPAIEQLFMVYYRGAEEEEEGEWLLAIGILRRIQKASKMTFSARQASYFGRISVSYTHLDVYKRQSLRSA